MIMGTRLSVAIRIWCIGMKPELYLSQDYLK